MSTALEIVQDDEINGEIGSPLATFWAKGHGHDPRGFIRAVVDYCLGNDVDIPAIAAGVTVVETYQQNVVLDYGVEYRRSASPPTSLRSPWFPITLLDLETDRRRGGAKCSVNDCGEPLTIASYPVRVCVEPGSGEAVLGAPYMAVTLWLCREHRLPDPAYRVCLVPVGAKILLPPTDRPAAGHLGGED